jgi:hypothetical protein
MDEADRMLDWANSKNPGRWMDHSRHAGRAAKTIAEACGMDGAKAYVLGLLHDVGRYDGIRDLHHVISGCKLMEEKGYSAVSRICLTHSFPIAELGVYSGQSSDCLAEELEFLSEFLEKAEFDDYDRLIQLCDALCLSTGICTVERRLVDVGIRYGSNAWSQRKWVAVTELKDYFDKLCGFNIYRLFQEEICRSIFG